MSALPSRQLAQDVVRKRRAQGPYTLGDATRDVGQVSQRAHERMGENVKAIRLGTPVGQNKQYRLANEVAQATVNTARLEAGRRMYGKRTPPSKRVRTDDDSTTLSTSTAGASGWTGRCAS